MPIDLGGSRGGATAAALLSETVSALGRRTPSIAAAAAHELGSEILNIHFDDGSALCLRAMFHGLSVDVPHAEPTVEAFFGREWLVRLYDLDQRPADALAPGGFDARGSREAILAVWRTFVLLSQRAAGLRYVQTLWSAYRARCFGEPSATPPERAPSAVGKRYAVPDAAALLRRSVDVQAGSASVATTRVLWDGRGGESWWTMSGTRDGDLAEILRSCQERTAAEIERMLPPREPEDSLYRLMRDYPRRGGKGLRPALCMSACGAFGGQAQDAVRTSAAIEMFHNAFLVHDDIEDESDSRRGKDCLHVAHGIGLAVNVGDGLNLMAVDAVLSNIERLGLARTLALIHEIIHMCRETIEGQAMELGWIRHGEIPPSDEDYFTMVTKKTGWYTCMSPCRLGAIAAGHTRPRELDLIGDVFHKVGVAFQIQDDLLNLLGKEELYGKEPLGDLLEGKRTLMLIHLYRSLDEPRRQELKEWLQRPRAQRALDQAEAVLAMMHEMGSIEYGQKVAARFASNGATLFEEQLDFLPESEPKAILRQVAHYVKHAGALNVLPGDELLLRRLRTGTETLRAALCAVARRGKALRRDEPERADLLLDAVQAHPLYKAARVLFDLNELEDLMLDGPEPAPAERAFGIAAIRVLTDALVRLERLFVAARPDGEGTSSQSSAGAGNDDAPWTLAGLSRSIELQPEQPPPGGWPQLEAADYLYDLVVLGVLRQLARVTATFDSASAGPGDAS